MKTILLPTDFSNNSWNTIYYAIKMFESQACHFILLNTYKVSTINVARPMTSTANRHLYDAAKQSSHEELAEMQRRLQGSLHNDQHTFETYSKYDSVRAGVASVLAEKDIDLVIMGTKGATGAKEVFLGSNTVKVIKHIRSCPVLVVPNHYEFTKLKKIVFPTDFTHFFNRSELLPMMETLKEHQARLHIFHVAQTLGLNEEQEYNKAVLKKHLAPVDFEFHKVDIKTTVTNAIEEFSEAINADMIALVHYQHTFLEKITQEPVVKKVAFHTEIPLMVLPELEN